MIVRPFKCPLCLSAFRTESGMKWHLAHKHETPAAVDAICQDYKAKVEDLEMQNTRLQKQLDETIMLLQSAKSRLEYEIAAKEKSWRDNKALIDFCNKMMIYFAALDINLLAKYNISIPNPFKLWLDEWNAKCTIDETKTNKTGSVV